MRARPRTELCLRRAPRPGSRAGCLLALWASASGPERPSWRGEGRPCQGPQAQHARAHQRVEGERGQRQC
eukprot:6290136-Alexandrium_andersonii.AAC.1